MQLLSRGWPDVMSGRADEAKEVSRLLGEDHDLHVLVEFATGRGKKAPHARGTRNTRHHVPIAAGRA